MKQFIYRLFVFLAILSIVSSLVMSEFAQGRLIKYLWVGEIQPLVCGGQIVDVLVWGWTVRRKEQQALFC